MKIETTRFGTLEIEEGDQIRMRGPILGFERLTRFVLLIHDEQTPLWWLQSVEEPGVAFVVANPRVLRPDYEPEIPAAERELLGIGDAEEAVLLGIVTVRMTPFRVTVNLKAPILVNAVSRMAKQIVLEDPDYPVQHDVFDHRDHLDPLSVGCGAGFRDGAGGLGKCVAAL